MTTAEKHVAYVLDAFPNTSETFISNEINELIALGWEVSIFSLHKGTGVVHLTAQQLANEADFQPRPVPRLLLLESLLYFLFRHPLNLFCNLIKAKLLGPEYWWAAKQSLLVAAKIGRARCDRIHVHFAAEAGRYGMFAASYLKIPFSLTVHNPFTKNESDSTSLRIICGAATAVITVCKINKDYLVGEIGLFDKKVFINPNGVKRDLFLAKKINERIENQIITVARLHSDKGIIYIIEAANILRDRGVKFQWLILGDGPERASIEDRIVALNLSGHIKLMGFQSSDRVSEELKKASLFVLSSVNESQGVVYLEAMATMTPIVGTAIPAVAETVLDNETGFLVPLRDPEALADKIELLLHNRELCEKFSAAGFTRLLNHYLLEDKVKELAKIWSMESRSTRT